MINTNWKTKIRFFSPVALFLLMLVLFIKGLRLDPKLLPSALIDKPVPPFRLSTLDSQQQVDNKIFNRHWTVLNVWASWCLSCNEEHSFLLSLSKDKLFTVIGLNYKDSTVSAERWLKHHGNPYQTILVDPKGRFALDLGIYGTPESYLIDPKGFIRYRHVGPLSKSVWDTKFKPLLNQS